MEKKPNTFRAAFEANVLKFRNKIAVRDPQTGVSLTYEEADIKARKIAAKLKEQGVKKGDAVAIVLPHSMEFILSMLAAAKLGAAFAPLNGSYPPDRLQYIFEDCKAKAVITPDYLKDAADYTPISESTPIAPEDPAVLVYTSGSTGNPKGVLINHLAIYDCASRNLDFAKANESDVIGLGAPFFFIAGATILFGGLVFGATNVLIPMSAMRDPAGLATLLAQEQVTITFISPKMLRYFKPAPNSRLRLALAGSERLSGIYSEEYQIMNTYGMTETCGGALAFMLDKAYDNTPVGKPMGDMAAYILDEDGNEAEEGELCLSGNFASCYLNRPEESAKTFTENPFKEKDGNPRMLRTGDLAKRLSDGNILYLNRRDWMVKINGQRVEPGEIEAALRKVEGVLDAAVKDFTDARNSTYLATYYVPKEKEPIPDDRLRLSLLETLPEYMVPAFFIPLEKLPLNANGKLDRSALSAPDVRSFQTEYAAPETPLQERLCKVFAEILSTERIGLDDDFFAMGGDSVKAAGLLTVLTDLPLAGADLYSAKTVRKLVELLEKRGSEAERKDNIPANVALAKVSQYPLTPMERGMYLEQRLDPDSISYNLNIGFFIEGADADTIKNAATELFLAHESLHSRYGEQEGVPSRILMTKAPEINDEDTLNREDFEALLEDPGKPFLLEEGIPARLWLYPIREGGFGLHLQIHHIAFDGGSAEPFVKELIARLKGEAVPEDAADLYSVSVQSEAAKEREAEALALYEKMFEDGVPATETPIKGSRPKLQPLTDTVLQVGLDPKEITALEEKARQFGVTLFELMLSVSAAVLGQYCASSDVVIGIPVNTRDTFSKDMVGMFVNIVPVRIQPGRGETLFDYLGKTAETVREATRACNIPFETLVNRFCKDRDESRNPLFDMSVNFLPVPEAYYDGTLSIDAVSPLQKLARDLSLVIRKSESAMQILLQYPSELFDSVVCENFLEQILEGLRKLAWGDAVLVRDLTALPENQIKQLEDFSVTGEAELPETVFHRVFEAHAAKTPEHTAVIACDRTLTYGELNSEANRVAASLIARGIGKGGSAVLLLPRRSFYFSAMFGVLKTGAAFIPCDPEYPAERIRHILKDSGSSCIITTEEHVSDYAKDAVIDIKELLSGEDKGNPEVELTGEDMAYMIYTSGSTGKPKGVMMKHVCVVNCVYPHPVNEHYHVILNQVKAILGVTTVSFDMSFQETAGALLNGKTLVFANEEELNDPRRLTALFEQTGANCFDATPSRLMQYMEYAPFREALSKCCLVMVGGEGVPQTLLENLQKVLSPEAHIENAYGPTETTMACNGADMIHMDHVAAGKPLLNYKSYIVDKDGEPVPVGVVGELWIGGIGVGIGYRNLPELTAQKFITYRGKRVYRSGDYAKWDTDGNVLILGRMDNQVKLRGLRIELDEIKGLMEQQPGIKQAVVAIKKIGDEDQLCSWYTSDREIDVHGLRDALRAKLTAYMVPVAFTHVDDIPMTANGKTDLKALPEPEVLKEEIVPPQNEAQKQILDIAAEIIGNTNFGVRTELYSAGLTSLNSVALSIKLSETFGVNIQIRDFKENDTVEKLERLIRGTEKEEEFEVLSEYALTKTQEGIFFESKSHPGTTIYNIPVLLELSSEIKKDRLKSAVVSAIEAHPYLKTRLLLTEKGELRQKRMDDEPFSEADIEEVICGEIAEGKDTLVKPFDLLKDRLFRIKLIRAEKEEKSYLFIDVHHIVYDGMARLILLRDISRAYAGETLTKEKYSGFEAALAEEKLRGSEHYDRAKAYYTDLFDGCEPDCLPISDVQEDTTGSGEFLIPVDRVDLKAVKQFCTQKSVSENAFFTAAFGVTVAKFCGRSDAIFTTINNGRNDPRFMESVSMFVRTYPVLCKAGNRGISDYISEVGRQLVDSQSYDVYSFEEISRDLGVRSDLLFAWQGVFEPEEETFCGKPSKQIPLSLSEAKANIELQVYPYGEGIAYLCSFRKELYTESFIRRFLRVYEQVLSGFLAKERLSEISFLDAETEKQLESFNDVKADIEITDIVTLFRRQAAATPDAPAVVYLDKKYTYRQVDEISERIAAYLKGKGIGKEDVVSILIPRCEYMVLASLGVLKAGALYQPLDSTYPTERLEFMVQDAGAKLLIADRELRNLVSGYTGEILYLDEIEGLPPASSEIGSPKPEDGFIVLYTSGSTGTPKGVILEHRNLCNFVSWYRRYYDLKEDSVVAAYASYGFDADMMDLYPALTTGACVHIIAEDMRLDFPMLARYFDENSVTHSFMTTQVGRQFAEYYTGTTLKYLSVGGEKLAPMYPEGKSFTFYNLYGPTECTIVTTVYPIDRFYKRVPIGRPLDNFKLYVVDEDGRLLPPGVPGELWISGFSVGRGYLNRPEKTAEVFIENPFTKEAGYERVYKTGDIVRWTEDGSIDFVGRNDGQVKVRGFRIELTEVENVIREFPGVSDVTVQAFDAKAGGKFLAAYLTGENPVDMEALRRFIGERKPPYMVPECIMQIDSIPLNQNQKVNKRALPEPVMSEEAVEEEEKARPMTRFEEEISTVVKKTLGEAELSPAASLTRYGLTSISAIGLTATLAERFRVELPVSKLLDGASIVDIENLIFEEWMRQGFSAGEAPSEGVPSEGSLETSYPLSSVQLAVYYDAMKREEDTLYNIPMCFAFASIDAERLSEAVKAAVRAHSYINTHFAIIDGALSQVRNDLFEPEVEVLSMTEAEFSEYRNTFVRPFNLNAGPLYRFAVVNCKDGKTYLLYDIHHLVFDGFSNGVLLKEIGRAYAGETLTPSAYTYFDYAKEDAAFREGPSYKEESQSDSFMQNLQANSARPGQAGNRKEAEAYYDSMFKTFEAPAEIPADRTGSAENESVNGQLTEVYQVVSKKAVDAFCRGNEVTPSSFFLAVSFYTVSRFAGRRDIYLSTISSGREALKTHKLLGMFVHTLPLAMQFDREMTVKELIDASDTVMKNGIRHQSYPFAELASKYGYTTEIMYECQIGMTAEGGTIGGEAFESIPMRLETPKFKVTIAIVEHGGEYGILVRYNDALYTKEYMETLAESLKEVSERMLKEPSASVKTLSLLSEKEGKIIEGFRQSAKAEIPEKLLHRVFEKQAKAFPDKTALIACDQTLTFKELNETANRISWKLIERGVKRGEPIVLLLPRRSFYFAALFGVLKAGAAFIPCDPEYPTERIQTILEDSEAAFLITTKERGEAYPEENTLFIEELLTGDKTENPKVELTGEDLAYMIYTSGSTGKPKGVMLKHEGICSFCTLHPANILYDVINKGVQTMLAVTTVSFDLSLKDTLGVFCNGKTVVFANEEQMNDPIALTRLMNEHKVDAMNGTPSRFVQYLEYKPFADALSKCALVLAGGEAYPVALLKRLRELGIRDIINTYGPTETTISSNMALLNNAEYISVGRPLLNYSEYIVDLDGNRVPRGVTGELLIGGPGVAKGYRNLPEQTKQRFVLYNGERVYRSGDYAKWDRDGNVLILGRMDGQVKLRGLRIELSEIEGLIEEQDGIVRAVAAVRKLNGQDNLCAWFTAERKIDVQDLRDALAKKLTHYMVPTAIMQVDTIPTTLNGKTDIKALPEPVVLKQGEYEPPVNEIERFFCSLFENVLEVDKVGVLDDFFAIGGTSLAATSIMIEATDAGYELKYGDIFKYKTPRELAALFTKEETSGKTFSTLRFDRQDYTKIGEVLSRNTLASFQAGEKRTIGNILLTGATGYMGIHVLAEYLRTEKGTAYCLVRKGRFESAGKRLKNMLVYYFSEEFAEADDRIEAIDGDVTDYATFEALKKFPIDTVFNCAANVKHFSSGTDIEDINVGGAKNCIRFCEETGARLIHFSTTSVAGALIVSSPSEIRALDEQSLYFGQVLENQYTSSKMQAEIEVLSAVAEQGLDAKIIRVGTLAARESDGEFQINFLSNSSMGRLRSFAILKRFPYLMMNNPLRMGPIDLSAKSFLQLARTPKECCLFHAINSHVIPMIDVIRIMNEVGLEIAVVEDQEFVQALSEAEKDPKKAAIFQSMLAYQGMNGNAVPVQVKCEYSNQVLGRLGFYWNATDSTYIKQFISGLMGLGFFDEDNLGR